MGSEDVIFAGRVVGLALELFIIAALLGRRGRRRDHFVAAAILFAAGSFPENLQIPLLLLGADDAAHSVWMLPVAAPYLAVGPALYFYVRSLASPVPLTWRVIGRTEIALCAGGLVLGLIAAVADTLRPAGDMGSSIAGSVTLGAIVLVLPLMIGTLVAYAVRTIRLAIRHRRSLEHHFSSIEGRTLAWVPIMVAILAILIVQNLFTFLLMLRPGGDHPVLGIINEWTSTAVIFGFGLIVLRQEAVYEPAPPCASAPSLPCPPEPEPERYLRSALDAPRMERLAGRIGAVMAADRLHRNHFLTLSDLAGAVGSSEHHVSQVLNEGIGCNFFDYVNGHRIRDACTLLAGTDTSIVAIGEEVGFNSRSTFNAAFKKVTGKTPSQFRAEAGRR